MVDEKTIAERRPEDNGLSVAGDRIQERSKAPISAGA